MHVTLTQVRPTQAMLNYFWDYTVFRIGISQNEVQKINWKLRSSHILLAFFSFTTYLWYLAARNFMLSGTARTFEGYDLYMLWGVRDFQAFISSPALIFWSEKLIWLSRCPLFLFLKLLLKTHKNWLKIAIHFSNSKNKGYRDNQINFLLQNINAGDEMKAWKSLTPHNMNKSYPSKVLYLIAWNS